MRYRSAAVIVLTLMLARPALANDISGVRIGSTLAEASIAIKRANKAFVMKPIKYDTGLVAGVTGIIGPGERERNERAADEFAVLQDERGKVWFVGRYQRMVPGSRVSMEALLASLTQKFGAPALRRAPGRVGAESYAWDTDRSGMRIDPSERDSPCDGIDFARPPIAGTNIRQPIGFPGNCGKRIALAEVDEENGLVRKFTLQVIDATAATHAINVRQMRRDAELERERRNGNKPQI